jgi:calcium-dependent protein kinase
MYSTWVSLTICLSVLRLKSVGVIAYMLMSSQMPFYGRQRKQIVEQITKGSGIFYVLDVSYVTDYGFVSNSQYEFKGRRWKRISKAAKTFVEDLLVVDPEDRATAEEATRASWLNRRNGATVRNARDDEINSARASILKYSKYSKLQKMALMVIAHKSTSSEIGILRKIFQQYDTEKDGQLSYDEFKAAIKETGLSEDEYRDIFDAVVSPHVTSLFSQRPHFRGEGSGWYGQDSIH